jgi:hypothetical protein
MLETIKRTRDYLDYIEEHYNNVQKAWFILKDKCWDMDFIKDRDKFEALDRDIKNHDISKLSLEEFVPYRDKFFKGSDFEEDLIEERFKFAWENHKEMNDHHWQTWTKNNYVDSYMQEVCCVHMVCDWMAMSMKFGDTAKDYYENNKDKIDLPEWSEILMYKIFDRIYEV